MLFGRWHYQPGHPAALRPCYHQLADLALTTGCRFWLQDLRRRAAPDQKTKRWLVDEYYPQVARSLGQRLFVAYLFSPEMHRQIIEAPDYAPPEAYHEAPFALDFFGSEGSANRVAASASAGGGIGGLARFHQAQHKKKPSLKGRFGPAND